MSVFTRADALWAVPLLAGLARGVLVTRADVVDAVRVRRGGQPPRREAVPAPAATTEGVAVTGETDLAQLLRTMSPQLRPERFVFVTMPTGVQGLEPMATVVEAEGVSAVVTVDQAAELGAVHAGFVGAWITLEVHSALDAVGLTAAVSTALTRAGISCNVIAGARHDHLLVPWTRRAEAVAILERLSAGTPDGTG